MLKKWLLVFMLGAFIIFSKPAHADLSDLNYFTLNDSSGAALSSYAMAGAVITQGARVRDNTGQTTLILDVSGGGVTVSYELSADGTNWYAPSTTNGSSLTSSSTVVSNLSTASNWIILTYQASSFIRFTITPAGGSPTITAKLLYRANM